MISDWHVACVTRTFVMIILDELRQEEQYVVTMEGRQDEMKLPSHGQLYHIDNNERRILC